VIHPNAHSGFASRRKERAIQNAAPRSAESGAVGHPRPATVAAGVLAELADGTAPSTVAHKPGVSRNTITATCTTRDVRDELDGFGPDDLRPVSAAKASLCCAIMLRVARTNPGKSCD
jgi:hypothetical protein